ncbi:MAG: hypothetical protein EAX96_09875 [Candidatus Lokiarchaeota archaeon]|nr:hypothetical protein [Candidatus Lokiarchaeota archaeon]
MQQDLRSFSYKGRGSFEPNVDIKEFLFQIIEKSGPITRGEIKELTNIPRTTIYDTIVKLILMKKIKKFTVSNKKRGRPKVYYKIIK